MPRSIVLAGLLGFALGCSMKVEEPAGPPVIPPAGPPPQGGCASLRDGCQNVVDKIVVELLFQSGRRLRTEDPAILCRRASIDLNGIIPTDEEVREQCRDRRPEEIIRHFMDKPKAAHIPDGQRPYEYVSRRHFADLFRYRTSPFDQEATFYADVASLDQLVDRLYAGQLPYDAFAIEALAHPAFARRFGLGNTATDLPAIAGAAYRIFLGREALPSDAADFGNLFRPLSVRLMYGAESQRYYPGCGSYCTHYEVFLQGGVCTEAGGLLCQSQVLGPARITPSLPAGTSVRLSDLSPRDAAELRKAGRLIVARREFAEAAVDRALSRYLGWWNAGVYRPDYNLPAVRQALADFFVARKYNVRDLDWRS